jgi:hypothetical protein
MKRRDGTAPETDIPTLKQIKSHNKKICITGHPLICNHGNMGSGLLVAICQVGWIASWL